MIYQETSVVRKFRTTAANGKTIIQLEVFIYGIKNQRTYKIIRPDRLSGRAFGLARHAQLQFRAAGDRRGLSGL